MSRPIDLVSRSAWFAQDYTWEIAHGLRPSVQEQMASWPVPDERLFEGLPSLFAPPPLDANKKLLAAIQHLRKENAQLRAQVSKHRQIDGAEKKAMAAQEGISTGRWPTK